jgi:hypothetical protein
MSARLFACYTLIAEHQPQNPQQTPPPQGRMTRRGQSSKLPILKVLQAFVHIESSSLGQTVEKKTVQFSAYDGSSTKPPRDSVLGSHVPRHANIDAMVQAMEEVNRLVSHTSSEEGKKEIIASLQGLGSFLNKLEALEEGTALRKVCAKSMPFRWVQLRFRKAALMYRQDINKLWQCLQHGTTLIASNQQLNLEKKLAESLGRAIRYHLRRYFNPIYGTVIEDPSMEEAAFKRQSKIYEILQMKLPEWYNVGSDSAVVDGSVSSVLGLAVETIIEYFGTEPFLEKDFQVPPIPDEFCCEPPSRRGIKSKRMSKEDVDVLLEDTSKAQGFLAASKACRFLAELKNWPGVKEEIARLGGWSIVEKSAKQFDSFRLDRLSPNDAHFVVLQNMDLALERFEQCWIAWEQAANTCTEALDGLWARFDCSTKSNAKKEKHPEIDILANLLLDGLKTHMFPHIAEPEPYYEEEAEESFDASEAEE